MSDQFVQLEGLDKALAEIDGVAERARNWSPIATDIGILIQADVDQRYQSSPPVRSGGKVYGGVTWPALSESYLKARPIREGGKIGLDTGRSRQSFTVNASGNVFEVGPQTIVFGSNLPEVRGFHRKRPLIFAHDDLIKPVVARLETWVIGGN